MDVSGVGTPAIQGLDIKNMDIETALMMVQTQRASLLETQLANQIQEVKIRNDKIAKLNDVLNVMNKITAGFKGDAKADAKAGKDLYNKYQAELKAACEAAGISPEFADKVDNSKKIADLEKQAKAMPSMAFIFDGQISKLKAEHNPGGAFSAAATKGKMEAAINGVKGQIDAANNSSQMDMLRLQSLTNKRNEAFDVMTNFIKKMQDSRSSIIGNMR